jgi:hypothetical protein
VWEAAFGGELLTLKGHTSVVYSVSWSPDGKRLATGSGDGTPKVWEAADGETVQEWARQERTREDLMTLNAFRGPQAKGFIQSWLLLLPFPMATGESGSQALDRQQIHGEAKLRPRPGALVSVGSQKLVWREHHSPEPVLDFNAVLGQVTERSVAYAVCYLESDRVRHDLWLRVDCDDHAKVYLNGEQIYRFLARSLGQLDTTRPIVLKQGTNLLVFKVVNEPGDWQGCVRLVDKAGRPANGIRVKLAPE